MTLLNEYMAAATVGLSPTLLRWLSTYAPKSGTARKLAVAKKEKDTLFFEESELLSFNEWLKLPWPHETGERPRIPNGIREEIRAEANGACAICQANADTCEAAHLEPVSKTKCNHPENLLWLCSNHHTAYDGGLFGPAEEDAEFVKAFKVALHRHKRMLWLLQSEVSQKLFLCLVDCDRLAKELQRARTPTQVKAVKAIARNALELLPTLTPTSRKDPAFAAYAAISTRISALKETPEKTTPISVQLKEAQDIKADYVDALGYIACPLCNATGSYEGSDCPVCHGDCEIEEKIADTVDIALYEYTDCPLCEGHGQFDGDDCPECGAEGRMWRRDAEHVDVGQYKKVKCPLCKGGGKLDGDDCPECGGEGRMWRRYADQVDIEQYKKVNCPLCKGDGKLDGDACPECGGDGQMWRRDADNVDLGQYNKVKCPLCEGEGNFDGDGCPECGSEGRMARRDADNVDLGQYKKVKCPLCEGQGNFDGDDCPECGGEGRMARRDADNVDLGQYKKVKCPLCKGDGNLDGNDCPECGGDGRMCRRDADNVDLEQYKKVRCPRCRGTSRDSCRFCGGDGEVYRTRADHYNPDDFE